MNAQQSKQIQELEKALAKATEQQALAQQEESPSIPGTTTHEHIQSLNFEDSGYNTEVLPLRWTKMQFISFRKVGFQHNP